MLEVEIWYPGKPRRVCVLGDVWEDHQPQFLFLDPLHISETSQARTLKFGNW